MRALSLQRPGDLQLVEVDPPAIRPDELLVRTLAVTICSSDLHDIRVNPFGIELPVVMGHEAAGIVVEVGSAVSGFRAGDRIAAHPVHPCGACAACRGGTPHLCLRLEHFGLNLPGTFAESFRVRADRARLIRPGVAATTAALAEPVCVSLEALLRGRLEPGQSLLIVGDGPFGVLMARLSARLAPGRVVIAGHHDARLAFAGDVERVNTKGAADIPAALLAANGGAGYDVAILTSGGAAMLDAGLEVLRPRGRLVVFAPLPGKTPVDLLKVLTRELEIVGAVNDDDLFDEAMAALADPALALAELVTHRFPIEEYRQAFALAERGHDRAMKVAIVFPEQ